MHDLFHPRACDKHHLEIPRRVIDLQCPLHKKSEWGDDTVDASNQNPANQFGFVFGWCNDYTINGIFTTSTGIAISPLVIKKVQYSVLPSPFVNRLAPLSNHQNVGCALMWLHPLFLSNMYLLQLVLFVTRRAVFMYLRASLGDLKVFNNSLAKSMLNTAKCFQFFRNMGVSVQSLVIRKYIIFRESHLNSKKIHMFV